MNKNNRWDYIDPQLQNMYKRQFARTIDNGQSTTTQPFMQKQPEYIDSDLIKQTMAGNPLTGQEWRTPIPAQKLYPTIPYPSIPDTPYNRKILSSLFNNDPEGKPLTSFKDGLAQYGKRLANDFSYNIGKLKSWWNNEDEMQAAYRNVQKNFGSLSSVNNEDLLKEIEKSLKMRQWGEVIKFEYEERMDKRLVKYLKKQFKVHSCDMYAFNGPLDLTFLMKCYGIEGFEDLKEAPYIPQKNKKLRADKNIFNQIRKGDVLLHHPYESFDPIVAFIKQAAEDENVLAIKQTLYRVSGHSPIIAALAQAAENGKQVTVLVELKARFDEENNINWARKLEKAGCHVIYGLVGLKTHCKIALVVRREADGIRRYVHLGTGNYNDSTAKLYTDTGMFTCRNAVGEDATAVFNMLSGYSEPANWNQLIVAPIWMKKRFLEMIARETQNAKEGKPARIIAKCNSLCDRKIILALYEASCAGVQIDLIVRGICCLVAGKPGVSENIRVRSIVGTFLEHARIFYFYNDGNEEVYMGSADWMPRNLDRRVEIVFPVEAPDLKEKAKHILDVQLRDTLKAHCLLEDGTYRKVDRRGKEAVEAQKTFCEEAIAAANESKEKVRKKRTFDPLFSPQEAE